MYGGWAKQSKPAAPAYRKSTQITQKAKVEREIFVRAWNKGENNNTPAANTRRLQENIILFDIEGNRGKSKPNPNSTAQIK